jgi:hypothetical protein
VCWQQTTPGSLWIGVDYDQFDHLAALEANMDLAVSLQPRIVCWAVRDRQWGRD